MDRGVALTALILLYHRISESEPDPWGLSVSPGHFVEHLDVLRRHARPARLSDVVRNERDAPGAPSVAITFDDGYADNASHVKPLLERFDVPATVFVTTGCIETSEFWWDELCRHTLGDSTPDALRGWRAWHGEPTPNHARYRSTWESMRILPHEERRAMLDGFRASTEQRTASSDCRPLNRTELASLASCELVDLGCHTRTHPVLAALDPSLQREEIAGSASDLEAMTGAKPALFAFPYGHRSDYGQEAVGFVRDAGFDAACANVPGLVRPDVDRFQLPRLHVDDWNGDEFARRISGCFDACW